MAISTPCRKEKPSALRRTLIGILLAVAIFSVLSLAAAPGVFHALFARKSEVRLISHYAPTCCADSGCTLVRIPAGDYSLQGYLFGQDSRRGLIIVAHGFHSDADSHLGEILYFARQGWCVLAFDGTGAGQSDGKSTVGLEQMRRDLRSVMDYVHTQDRLSGLPVVLYGHSMGGYAVAALADAPDVAGVISVAGFNEPVETMVSFSRKYIGVLADLEYPVIYLQDRFLFGADANTTAVEAINATDTPVMIVYGSADQTIPYSLSIYAHRGEITNANAEYIYIDEAYRNTHSTGWLSDTAARNTLELNVRLDALLARYGEDIPVADRQALAQQLTRKDIFAVDDAFMAQLDRFCTRAAEAAVAH